MAQVMTKLQAKITTALTEQTPHASSVLCALVAKLSEMLALHPGKRRAPMTFLSFGQMAEIDRVCTSRPFRRVDFT